MFWTVSLLVCGAFLLGIASLFVWLDFRASFGPTFTYFARQLAVTSLVVVELQLENWPNQALSTLLYLNWALHLLTLLFLLNAVDLMRQSAWVVGKRTWRFFLAVSAVMAVLVFLPDFLTIHERGQPVPGYLYRYAFFPYCVITVVAFLVFLGREYKTAPGPQRRQRGIHLLSTLLLIASGLLTLFAVLWMDGGSTWTYRITPVATLGFGAMCAQFFAREFFKTFRERQELFDRLGALSQDLSRLQPLGQLGQNAAYISHEIKNYVGVLKANSLILQSKFAGAAALGEMERIHRSTDRLEQFTRSILDFSQASKAVHLHVMDWAAHLHEMAAGMRKSSFANISVDAVGPCLILGDRLRLEQLMNNLFKNSLEAGARNLRIRLTAQPATWCLEFEDDGCGCAAADLEQLSKPFFTTKRHQGGSGLGLALVASILSNHGGDLSFEQGSHLPSKPGGLRVRCRLPAYSEGEAGGTGGAG